MKYFFYTLCLFALVLLLSVQTDAQTAAGTTPTPAFRVTETRTPGAGLVPCTDGCGFSDVFILINNVITFLITELFIPLLVLMCMYAGYTYIAARGNPAKVANVKKMMMHIVVGMILVLCSWLLVKTVLGILVRSDWGGVFLQ
jgi:hypothetical protein